MRRLAFLLILLLLIPSISQARPRGIYKTVASGTVTQANMRLSGVDGGATASGGAFVDFGYKYQSDFSAGEDSWTAIRGTAAGNIDSIGGEDNWVRFTATTASGAHYLLSSESFVVGKKYKVIVKYFIPSGQTEIAGILLRTGTTTPEGVTFQGTLDTVVTYTSTFVALDTNLRFYATTSAGLTTVTDPGGDDVFYIKDIKIEENPPTSYLGHLLKITDSAGKSIMGYIKAAGTEETLSDELITGWTNNATSPFNTTWTSSGVDITSAISTTSARASASVAVSSLRLYKYTGTFTKNSGSFSYLALASGITGIFPAVVLISNTATNGDKTVYVTSTGDSQDYLAIYANSAANLSLTSNSFKQVLTPSATGVTIVSSKGGATYNWFNKNSAFNWNDASGYKYEIIQENGKEIYAPTITSGQLHLDASATAMFFHDSIDFSSYAGTDAGSTPYLIAFYDSSGYMAYAYGGAIGGSETAPDESITGWSNSATAPYGTLTVNANGHDIDVLIGDAAETKGASTDANMSAGKLYKIVADITLNSGTAPYLRTLVGTHSVMATITDQTKYWTAYGGDAGLQILNINNAVNASLLISQKVLTDVPVTGLHLMTTKNGTTRGMASSHASFNPNTITKVKIYRAY